MPNGLAAANGEVRYTFNQRNLLVQIENHDGSSYLPQAEMGYDGAGNHLQSVSFVLGTAMTITYTLDSMNNRLPLALANGTDTRYILYGLFGLGEFSTAWTFYLGDGQLSVRQLMDGNGNIALSRTYSPFGQILQEVGNGTALPGHRLVAAGCCTSTADILTPQQAGCFHPVRQPTQHYRSKLAPFSPKATSFA